MTVSLAAMKARLPSKDRAEVDRRTAEILAEVRGLKALRQARSSTQKAVAKRLKVSQASVAKLEQRTDVLISTLRQYVEALGGRLDLVVSFDGDAKPLRIAGFSDLAGRAEPQRKRQTAGPKRGRDSSRPRADRVLEKA